MDIPRPQATDNLQEGAISNERCPHCDGGDILTGVKIGQNAEVGRIGLVYKTAAIFQGAEQLFGDLCQTCGTVMRFYVKDPNRNWVR